MWNIWLWIREALSGIVRNFTMNLFAFILSTICFLVLAFWMVIGMNTQFVSNNLEDKVQISLNLNNEITNYSEIEEKIKALDGVESYRFVSKEEAYEEMLQKLGDRKEMLTDLSYNPLPASFQVKLKNPKEIEKTALIMKTWGVTKSIKYGEDFIDNLFATTEKIKQLATMIIIVMGISTGSMLYVSIRVNILNRNKEIEIKDLVGAGMFNIRIPFILEAMILTTLSAIVVIATFYFGYDMMIEKITGGVSFASYIPVNEMIKRMIPVMLLTATGIGFISSFLSTQRYLKRH
jgi:cell division transport system permease protein